MSLQAYQQASQRTEPPRDLEYRLFGQVTRALLAASALDARDASTLGERIDALDWNRRVWSALANECADPANQLAAPVRANIISLSLWVNRHSSAVMRGQEAFQDLIDVNRIMMQALEPRAAA